MWRCRPSLLHAARFCLNQSYNHTGADHTRAVDRLIVYRPTSSCAFSSSSILLRMLHSAPSISVTETHPSTSAASASAASSTVAAAAATTSTSRLKRRLSPTTARRQFESSAKRHITVCAQQHASASAPLSHSAPSPYWSTVAITQPATDFNMSSAPIMQADPVLVLTDLEKRIFAHVLAACEKFKLQTQVRVAGGWVRDKLLGLESADIDFALNDMSGEEFSQKLAEYMKSIGEKTSSIGVIKVNPDQSKHLATATMKILDVSIDINNFREEIYHENSRIPEITLSTAKEDAYRRDFTTNSMFYNIHTNKIEDYVNGLEDLRNSLLRTPRDPFKTFSDDPLRILRAARFAGRFAYKVHPDISAAAQDQKIQHELSTKVSRERMGIEVGKMLEINRSAFLALHLLTEQWHLRRIIFEVPDRFEPVSPDMHLQPVEQRADPEENPAVTELALKAMHFAHEEILSGRYQYSTEEASALLLSAFLLPYHGYQVEFKKGKFNTLVWHIIRESLRLPQRDAQLASDLLIQAHQLIRISGLHDFATSSAASSESSSSSSSSSSDSIPPSAKTPMERLQLITGGLLRQSGQFSIIALRLAEIILRVLPEKELPGADASLDAQLQIPASWSAQKMQAISAASSAYLSRDVSEIVTKFAGNDLSSRLSKYVEWIAVESQLLKLPVWEMKPLASGTDICTTLNISAKGPHVGTILTRMLDWQMLHLDLMIPLTQMQQAQNASSSSSSTSASSSAVAPSSEAVTAELTSVKEKCYEWLRTLNLGSLVGAEKPKKK